MPVMTNALITGGRLAAGDAMQVGNLPASAQLGYGNHLSRIDGATPLVLRPLIGIVTHVPTMFQYVPKYPETLKALMEQHVIQMDGIDLEYTTESEAVPAGADGQEWQIPTNARRSAISPSARMYEVTGNEVWNFFTNWQKMCKDPDTQTASLAGVVASDVTLSPHVMSMWTMDMIWLQFSTDMRPSNLIDAFFTVGMWPHGAGPAGFTKELGTSTVPTRTIQFNGVIQHNRNTRAVGVQIAEALQLHRFDYNYDTPITTSIQSAISTMGLAAEATTNAATFGPLAGSGNSALPT